MRRKKIYMLYRNACAKNSLLNFVLAISRSGRPVEINSDKIKALVYKNHAYTMRDVTKILNVSKSSVENHLKALGYVSKLDVWTPHQLEGVHLLKRIIICDSLLKREENDPFLKRVITGDEKWIVCGDIERKES